ncbi:MAG TPA: hypothetical protein VHR88_00365 [Solirubrobacteraceae bacterium]|jgi:hypothetical protein|nr:hypothetical protein [Solirubrobacteraceae bacterium]
MGLLEDAIREHLDLKRQHGADPGEVAAEEHEALGPIQRAAEPAVIHDDDDVPEEAPAAFDEPVQAPADDLDEDSFEEEPPPSTRTTSSSAPFDFEDEPFAPEPPAAPPEEEQAAADEDVLEETPEFLQETPEHDRLWFEQKPPRDFDFDR